MDIDIKRNGSRPSTKGNCRLVHRIGPGGSSLPGSGSGAGERRPGHLRTRRPDRVAHAPARADTGRHFRSRMGAARGRTDRGDPRRRRRVVSAGPEALARRLADHRNDAHRHSGIRWTERTSIGWRRSPTTSTESEVMSRWDNDELRKIAEADDLHVSPFRADGTTYGTPTWIWSVAVDGASTSRATTGTDSGYRAATRQKAGRILAAGLTKEVTFERSRGGPGSDRRGLSREVSRQPVSRTDDRRRAPGPRPSRIMPASTERT